MSAFDLFLLDVPKTKGVVALARRGADTAIERVSLDATLGELIDFGRLIGKAVTGNAQRPSAVELDDFGQRLFNFLFRGSLLQLYSRLPQGPVSMQMLSDRSELREVPWEYLTTPDRMPAPHRERSVVRVHPTCGVYGPTPKKASEKIRVLFVSADPMDQAGVDWSEIKAVLDRTLVAQMPGEATIDVVEGATRAGLLDILARRNFDVFHFFGHGDLRGGVGHLVLQDSKTGKSDFLSAEDLAVALAGKGVQLAMLSACLSGAGKYDDDFGLIATALIRAGIPAVVANQYSIPIKSIAPFVGAVYTLLAQGAGIDQAVANGRVALKVGLAGTTGNNAVLEWGIPTLYRLADVQHIFERAP
ncbi:MAG: CHAT domain-containing protein [Tahibacter sp.]